MAKDLERSEGFSQSDTVPFNKVMLNMGGHFSLETYSFVCPMHGLYAFSVSFVAAKDRIDNLELRKNNVGITDIWAYDDDTYGSHGSGSISIVLECSENDDVRVVTGESGNIISVDNLHVFSGFLLNKL